MRRLGILPGLLLALLATLGAWRSWRDARAGSLFAQYKRSVEGGALPASRSRMDILGHAIDAGGSTADARAASAVERVARASAVIMNEGASPLGSRTEAAEELYRALADVREGLRAWPLDSEAWIAGYRVIESARILGLVDRLARERAPSSSAPPDSDPVRALRPALMADPGALAERFMQGALRSDPNGGAVQHQIGTVMLAAGHPDDAFPYLARAARDLGSDPARIASEMLDAGYAPEDIVAAMPRRFGPMMQIGRVLLERHLNEAAAAAFHDAAQLEPGAYEPWVALALEAEDEEHPQDALDLCKKALPLIPQRETGVLAKVLACAARASRQLGDRPQALAYGSRAQQLDPKRLELYHFMGTLLSEVGEDAGAIRRWQTLIEENPSNPYVLSHLAQFQKLIGHSYEQLGMRSQAIEHYLDALRASPQDGEAKGALERLAGRPSAGHMSRGRTGKRP